ncbi:hypothetical protein B9G69_012135 [Bdellovibrio sp. SKB1291214]|uniref:hypothetical protein n=1 Tax=Bdellovibrio sp. SKB1291214 TaxID=1732569 RepID=UPI0015950CE3|nr:hypothetical protein [Bdellovibrio sp. SKB1291214]UYL07794.1 hypothetical protein B9G69_012135 [Bdellovibrio sp. SKB1291214]
MERLKAFGFLILVMAVLGGGYALVSGSAEYRAQQDAKTITIHVSSTSAIAAGE